MVPPTDVVAASRTASCAPPGERSTARGAADSRNRCRDAPSTGAQPSAPAGQTSATATTFSAYVPSSCGVNHATFAASTGTGEGTAAADGRGVVTVGATGAPVERSVEPTTTATTAATARTPYDARETGPRRVPARRERRAAGRRDRKSTRLNSSHQKNSYAVFCS